MNAQTRALPFEDHPLSRLVEYSTVVHILRRCDFETTEALESELRTIESKLTDAAIEPRRIHALEDIISELALNVYIHGRPELDDGILICLQDDDLSVIMLGEGARQDIERLERALDSIRQRVTPHDPRKLFDLRNERAWATRHSARQKRGGAGLGMLTISALAREHPKFKSLPKNGDTAFYVRSRV